MPERKSGDELLRLRCDACNADLTAQHIAGKDTIDQQGPGPPQYRGRLAKQAVGNDGQQEQHNEAQVAADHFQGQQQVILRNAAGEPLVEYASPAFEAKG